MAPSSVPVSLDRLRVEVSEDSVSLANSLEDVSGNPPMVSDFEDVARTQLVFPLSETDFGVDS